MERKRQRHYQETPTLTPTLSTQLRSAVQCLIDAGQSQSDIAARAGIRQPPLSMWLRGKKQFNETTLDRLADVAGVKLATIQGVVATTAKTVDK